MNPRRAGIALAVWSALVVVGAALSLGAEEVPQASGKFTGKNWEFDAGGAYAYPGKVGFDDVPGIRVAVSNSTFRAETIDRFWDREHAIDSRFATEETLVVTFQFEKNGKYAGMSYSFGSGDGCGYCYNGAVVSTVKIANGRLQGKLTQVPEPDEISWDLTFDIPVAPSDYGTPLPKDGGELAAVYAAYHAALDSGEAAALQKIFPAELAAKIPENKDRILQVWREDHPTKSYSVVQGFTQGDRGLLIVKGENSYFKVNVEAHFLKENGEWKVDDEMSQVVLGEE